MIDPRIFRAYDIRGTAYTQITTEACHSIGRAFGAALIERYGNTHPSPRVVVGRDARTHSAEFESAMIEGLASSGCTVIHIGQTPSPVNYYTVCAYGYEGGAHITASHNPKDDNGIKLCTRDADAFSGEDLQRLRQSIDALTPAPLTLVSDLSSQISRLRSPHFDALTPYIHALTTLFPRCGEGLTIAVDSGNGVAGPLYCEILRRVGCDVVELYTEPDGTFPHHPADPSKYSTLRDLQACVREKKLHAGFAFDGDGDRLGVIDERGDIITADQTLLLLAKDHLARRPGAPIIFTVSNSSLLETEVRAWGGRPVMCKVGHSHVEHAMRAEKALLGGEQSGHFFCGEDYYGFDDAIVAALRILAIIRTAPGASLRSLVQHFPVVIQAPERRPFCPDDEKFLVIDRCTAALAKKYPVCTLDGVRADCGDGAWAGLRASNTSPCLSVCIEARSEEKLRSVEAEVLALLRTEGVAIACDE